ncbi:MAG: protoporphyrinogen oxidase HemJ [Idiomarina sp.]
MSILWFKALHLIFMVAWFAGIFYLPRLFVYHAQTSSTEVSEQLKVMERRLLFFVTPFAILTVIFGLLLLAQYGGGWLANNGWMHAKLTLVFVLIIYHSYCFKLLADFRHDRNQRSHKFYRVFNEFPVLVLFAIILLAVLKPF